MKKRPAPPLRGVLVFKNGYRHELQLPQVGGQRYYHANRLPDGRVVETLFEAEPDVIDDYIMYREVSQTERPA